MIQNQKTVSCLTVDRHIANVLLWVRLSFIFVGLLSPLYRKLRHLWRLFSKDLPWENSNKFLSWIWGRTASFSEVGGGSVDGRFTGESLGPRGAPGCCISSVPLCCFLTLPVFKGRERKIYLLVRIYTNLDMQHPTQMFFSALPHSFISHSQNLTYFCAWRTGQIRECLEVLK